MNPTHRQITLFKDTGLYNLQREGRPAYLHQWIPWLQAMLDTVPAEQKERVQVELCDDNAGDINFEIFYSRPMTEAEKAEEAAQIAKAEELNAKAEQERILLLVRKHFGDEHATLLKNVVVFNKAKPFVAAEGLPSCGFDASVREFAQRGCTRCLEENGHIEPLNRWMVVCSICGNKRCPHAEDHRFECTGSNEPGQTPRLKAPIAAALLHPTGPTPLIIDGQSNAETFGELAEHATEFLHQQQKPL